MILTKNLSKYFDDFLAVNAVNLDVHAGEVLVLLGPNGAGKTTTVRMLTSILRPSAGEAWVAGFNAVEQADKVRSVVGVLTEHHGLYNRMTSLEYLEFFGSLYQMERKAARQRILQLLEEFGLADACKKRLGEYSKGMRQKLALVRALLHNPPVLLLDEPTSAMDPESAHMVRDALRSLRNGERTIMLCTHNLLEADLLADQVAIIRKGSIILQGKPAEIKERLLGPVEYIARLAQPVNGWRPEYPDGILLTDSGSDWLRFRVSNPTEHNPLVVKLLISAGYDIIAFEEVHRSLEEAYLAAVGNAERQEVQND